MKNQLFAFGNALLDISAVVDESFLEKYGLEKDGLIIVGEKQKNLFKDFIDTYEYDIVPGGSSLNVLRMLQWIINEKNCIAYASCIGNDEEGRQLRIECSKSHLKTNFEISHKNSTGICCAMISKDRKYRSLATNLGATQDISEEFMLSPENLNYLKNTNVFYITGYFFMLKPQCIIKLAKELFDGNKRIVYNISAEFICNLASTYIVKLMQYVHIIIGNDQEFLSLAKLYNIEGKPKDLLKLLGEKIISQYNNHSLKLIMTCGSDPVFYAEFDDCEPVKFEKIEITKINPENIVDTNGAGDAFVGGFLSVYIKNENDYKRGIITGNKAAHYIIQQSGFTIQHDCTPPFM